MKSAARILAYVFLVFGITGPLFAAAPELRNVMPNSWEKLTRLSPAEEEHFAEENPALFSQMAGLLQKIAESSSEWSRVNHYRVYTDEYGWLFGGEDDE
jgi:hypothetical protein